MTKKTSKVKNKLLEIVQVDEYVFDITGNQIQVNQEPFANTTSPTANITKMSNNSTEIISCEVGIAI